MFKEKKINKVQVVPVVTAPPPDAKSVKGFDLIPMAYYNLFIVAKKKSGKSSVISTLCEKTTDKHTTFFLFVSTHRIDSVWIHIKSMLEKRGNTVIALDGIYDDNGKVDQLAEIIDTLCEEKEDEEPAKMKTPFVPTKGMDALSLVGSKQLDSFGPKLFLPKESKPSPALDKPKKAPKRRCPDFMFIFDDLSSQLRAPSVARLLKMHRHMKASCIISSQHLHDLRPESIIQMDLAFVFKGLPDEKLEILYKLLDIGMPYELFDTLYKQATSEPYSFMWLNRNDESVRRCFDTEIEY